MGVLFDLVRERVTARQAAEYYGMEVTRYGKALCPWHDDHKPSLSFDPRTGRCKCFSCNRGGGAVDLVAALLGCTPLEAAQRINTDFQLRIEAAANAPSSPPIGETPAQKRRRERAEESKRYSLLCDRERELMNLLSKYTPETAEASQEFAEALTELGNVRIQLENMS